MRTTLSLGLCLLVIGCGNVSSKKSNDMAMSLDTDMSLEPDDGGAGQDGGDDGGGPSCTAGMPCTYGGGSGLCVGGACVACNDPTDDANCVAAYGAGYLCIAGSCTQATCRTAADCSGLACIGNQCTAPCTDDTSCLGQPNTVCNTTTGVCVTNASCGATPSGMACPVNSADLCCGSGGSEVCGAVDCCDNTQCGGGTTCQAGRCVAPGCPSPSPAATRYVDPSRTTTGNNGSQICPYSSLGSALEDLRAGGQIVVKTGTSIDNVTSESVVPAGVSIVGSDSKFAACSPSNNDPACGPSSNWPRINVTGTKADGFAFTTGSGSLSFFSVNGPGPAKTVHSGVLVQQSPSGSHVTLDHVLVQGFANGIAGTAGGVLNLAGAVLSTNNVYGLFVKDGSAVNVTVPAGRPKTIFYSNLKQGIWIGGDGTTKATFTGAANGSTIESKLNGWSGVSFYSKDTTPPTFDGITIYSNGNAGTAAVSGSDVDGFFIFGGSHIKVRNAAIKDNYGSGVKIAENGASLIQSIDFGTCYGGSASNCASGDTPANNQLINNGQADLCIGAAVAQANKGLTKMPAEGITFAWGGGSSVACTSGQTTPILSSASCADPVALAQANFNVVDFTACTQTKTSAVDMGTGESCTPGAACDDSGGAGLCSSGGVCAACTDDPSCVTAYGSGYLCISGSCIQGNCRSPSDCGGQACTNNHCSACVTDNDCVGVANTICNTSSGLCVSNACTVAGSTCAANAADVCCNSVCAAGNCCGTGACSAGGVVGTCQNDICTTCPAPSPTNFRYLDPSFTGAGANGSQLCPYSSFTPAFKDLATGGTVVIARNHSFNGLTGARSVPGSVNLIGGDASFNPCTVATCPSDFPTLNVTDTSDGLSFSTPGDNKVEFLSLMGPGAEGTAPSGNGISVSGATRVTLDNVAIQYFSGGHGIQVTGGGTATIGPGGGVFSGYNEDGVYVLDNSTFLVSGLMETDPVVAFAGNNNHGIYVGGDGRAQVTVNGPVQIDNNGRSGISFFSTASQPSSFDGAFVTGNGNQATSGTQDGSGFWIYASSNIKVRNALIAGNAHTGVSILDYYPIGMINPNTVISGIDFGTCGSATCAAGTSKGQNQFLNNGWAGICIASDVSSANKGKKSMPADGNTFQWAGATSPVACTGTANSILTSSTSCRTSVAVCDYGDDAVDVASCHGTSSP